MLPISLPGLLSRNATAAPNAFPARVKQRRWLMMTLAASLLGMGCSSAQSTADFAELQKREVNEQIAGVWRLTSYVPDEQLSMALLLGLQSERIVIRFEDNRIKSATAMLSFDRPYRIDSVYDNGFKLFIQEEDTGVQYEVFARVDNTSRLVFQARTAPWRGHGVLEREGGALVTTH